MNETFSAVPTPIIKQPESEKPDEIPSIPTPEGTSETVDGVNAENKSVDAKKNTENKTKAMPIMQQPSRWQGLYHDMNSVSGTETRSKRSKTSDNFCCDPTCCCYSERISVSTENGLSVDYEKESCCNFFASHTSKTSVNCCSTEGGVSTSHEEQSEGCCGSNTTSSSVDCCMDEGCCSIDRENSATLCCWSSFFSYKTGTDDACASSDCCDYNCDHDCGDCDCGEVCATVCTAFCPSD